MPIAFSAYDGPRPLRSGPDGVRTCEHIPYLSEPPSARPTHCCVLSDGGRRNSLPCHGGLAPHLGRIAIFTEHRQPSGKYYQWRRNNRSTLEKTQQKNAARHQRDARWSLSFERCRERSEEHTYELQSLMRT